MKNELHKQFFETVESLAPKMEGTPRSPGQLTAVINVTKELFDMKWELRKEKARAKRV